MYIALISCASNVAMARYAKKQTDQSSITDDIINRIDRVEDSVHDLNKLMLKN